LFRYSRDWRLSLVTVLILTKWLLSLSTPFSYIGHLPYLFLLSILGLLANY
jgi:hypothetical protein